MWRDLLSELLTGLWWLSLVALGFVVGDAVGGAESGYWMERAVACWTAK